MNTPSRHPMLPVLGLLVTLALLSPALPAAAQTKSVQHSSPLAEARPQRVGVSPERLARIDAMCRNAVAEGDVPGVVALVARRGKIGMRRRGSPTCSRPSRSPSARA